tara:strand:+ start:531 stop:662 length:132 start_codon:yes stop_codon:yes gene_type:complete
METLKLLKLLFSFSFFLNYFEQNKKNPAYKEFAYQLNNVIFIN